MKILKIYFTFTSVVILLFAASSAVFSQEKKMISVEHNYNSWGWDSVFVAKNNFISVAVVPQAAGRVLEYNLGDTPSLWVNPKLFGKEFPPNELVKKEDWRNFGGYRLVPLPINTTAITQDGGRSNRWPPPAVIGDNPYSASIVTDKKGDQNILVISGVQDLPVPQFNYKTGEYILPEEIDESLRYSRMLKIQDNSSLVFINHRLENVGNQAVNRGIMISSQHVSESKPGLYDGENFLAYVPFDSKYLLPNGEQYEIMGTAESRWNYVNRNIKPLNKDNPEDVKKYYNHGTNWTGEVAPGIFEIHYDYELMSGFHMVASEAWLCYVNKTNNTAFVKIMEPYDPDLDYEDGTNAAIFCSGLETGYIETEVKTPLYDLKPGEHFDYKEIQGAAKIYGTPVLEVNMAGIITQKLSWDQAKKTINGKYGVFVAGDMILRVLEASGKTQDIVLAKGISPLKPVSIDYEFTEIPSSKVSLLIKDQKGESHLLDELN